MFCRNYEKGQKEVVSLAESTGYSFQDLLCSGSIGVEGEWVDPMKWYRCELELKSKKRPIPHEIVRRRDHYFAGAYPYFSQMLSNVEPEFILTPQQEGRLGLEAALAQIRRQYGRTLFTALMVEQGDIGAVWDRIVGSELNPTLVAAGALLK
jgi:DNA relaxase NicK